MSDGCQIAYDEQLHHMFCLTSRRAFKGTFLGWVEDNENRKLSDPKNSIDALLHIVRRTDSMIGLKPDFREAPHKVSRNFGKGELDLIASCELSDDIRNKKPFMVPDRSEPRASDYTLAG